MKFKYFSKNGEILPIEQAVIPLSNIEYSYGFGVYESIRVTNRIPYFLKEHLKRLAESTRIIGLEHPFSNTSIYGSVEALIEKNNVETCNIKILLVGGSDAKVGVDKKKEGALLYILCFNPLFPDKRLYKTGAHCITYRHERLFPHAKTLNMLGSYLAYRKAKESSAYDALLLNRNECVTEGTRTNFFCITDKHIVSPPEADILPGVTRKVLIKVVEKNGYTYEEKPIPLAEVQNFDGTFITSTSSKILPIRSIDSRAFSEPSRHLQELMTLFDTFLADSLGTLD